jgi:hypothetical protein
MKKIDYFLHAYFYQIESELNKNSKDLSTIKFQSEEANTDEELKMFFKQYLSQNNKLSTDSSINKIVLKNELKEDSIGINELKEFYIKNVCLPNELTEDMKAEIAESKNSVYTNPDLYLEIAIPNETVFVSVELKSTKGDNIPGSSVQQVSPYEWVIFIKHNEKTTEMVCGFYINSITEKLPFPDRSPRPQIGYSTLKEWNNKNRTIENNNLVYCTNTNEDKVKKDILENWESVLCNEWMETISKEKTKKEKWFNNTIRMFSYNLLKLVKDNPAKIDELLEIIDANITNKEV